MKSLFGKQNSGCQLFGGTIFANPNFSASGRILFIYSNGSPLFHSSSVGKYCGHGGISSNHSMPFPGSYLVLTGGPLRHSKHPSLSKQHFSHPNISFVVSEEIVGGFNFGGSPEMPPLFPPFDLFAFPFVGLLLFFIASRFRFNACATMRFFSSSFAKIGFDCFFGADDDDDAPVRGPMASAAMPIVAVASSRPLGATALIAFARLS
mmetsp:Transcript_5805/g.17046  ORF Transcript_5805/g.17046 Transcript_5805/m.17046 type:complete len:207 (+) Transcript_5805:2525-3145(+)